MKLHVIVVLAATFFVLDIAPTPPELDNVADAVAQSRRKGGGRSAKKSSNVNRKGSARSGSTSRRSQPSTSNRSGRGNRAGGGNRAGVGNRPGQGNRATPGGRNSAGRRTVSRRSRPGTHRRGRTRRVHRSVRWRRGPWRVHRFWHPGRWYGGFWPGRFIIRTVAFVAIANSSTTHVHGSVTYYHYNPWYRPVLYDGEEGHLLTAAPVGWQTDVLPDGAEDVTVDGTTYFYHEAAFYQPAQGGGYQVVKSPVGAEVSSIPEDAEAHDEGDLTLYQFDQAFFTRDTNDSGRTIYRVEPPPPEEELDQIPSGSPSFVADSETYYYVNFALYVEFEENGNTGYINGEPDVGAQAGALPEGATEIEHDGVTYHQFDMVFFEEVADDSGGTFYEVVDAPGESGTVEVQTG